MSSASIANSASSANCVDGASGASDSLCEASKVSKTSRASKVNRSSRVTRSNVSPFLLGEYDSLSTRVRQSLIVLNVHAYYLTAFEVSSLHILHPRV